MRKLFTCLVALMAMAACAKDPLKTDVPQPHDKLVGVFADQGHAITIDTTLGITGDSVKSFVEVELYSKETVDKQAYSARSGRVEMHCDKNEFTIITQFLIEKGTGKVLGPDKTGEVGKPVHFKESSVGSLLQAYVCKDYTGPKLAPKPALNTSQDVTI